MRDIDAGVDDCDLDVGAGTRHAAALCPCRGCADQRDIGVGSVRVVQALVLRRLHHRRGRHLPQRRAVELHRDRIQRDVEFAGDLGPRHVGAQPGLVVIAQRRQLGAIGLGVGVAEIDLLALRRLGLDVGRERIAVELHDCGAGVLGRAVRRGAIAVLAGLRDAERQRQ